MAIIQSAARSGASPNWVQQIVTGAIIVLAVALEQYCHRP